MQSVLDFSAQRNDRALIGKSWDLSLEAFINHCKAKNLRARSIEWYSEVLYNYFLRDFVMKNNIESPQTFSKSDLERFIVQQHKLGVKASTANVRLRALRTFINWMAEEEYMDKIRVKLIKMDKTIIQTFTAEQIKKLIEKPKNVGEGSFATYRDWAMINFLIGTGVRLATLREIRVGDINFVEREIVLIHTKGREQYVIPLSLSLAKILQEYLKVRQGTQESYLFCNAYGDMMHERSVQDRIKFWCHDRIGDNSGMRCSAHDFRHTFAYFFVKNGGDILTLSKILHHSSLEVTKIYCNMLSSDLKIAFAAYSPLDSIAAAASGGRKAIKMQR